MLGGVTPAADRPPNVVATYGMTETGSGVVYDGVPLDGVEVRIVGRRGAHAVPDAAARGYRDGTTRSSTAGSPTGDVGDWAPMASSSSTVGRGDLIITGGENVWPEPVEAMLSRRTRRRRRRRRRTPDDEWGQT